MLDIMDIMDIQEVHGGMPDILDIQEVHDDMPDIQEVHNPQDMLSHVFNPDDHWYDIPHQDIYQDQEFEGFEDFEDLGRYFVSDLDPENYEPYETSTSN